MEWGEVGILVSLASRSPKRKSNVQRQEPSPIFVASSVKP